MRDDGAPSALTRKRRLSLTFNRPVLCSLDSPKQIAPEVATRMVTIRNRMMFYMLPQIAWAAELDSDESSFLHQVLLPAKLVGVMPQSLQRKVGGIAGYDRGRTAESDFTKAPYFRSSATIILRSRT